MSSAVIRAFDGDARALANMLYSSRTGFAMTIEAGCNGVEAMLVLLAGIVAYPAPPRLKLIGLAIGVAAIQALNLVRIVSLSTWANGTCAGSNGRTSMRGRRSS